ncbi:MAG: endopygalactorunase, partial [Bacteroidetes bacterium]|nr:endopygalactorunase [Bacteroidota bacterium]
MQAMNKSVCITCLVCVFVTATAIAGDGKSSSVITLRKNATHIVAITKDTIIVAKGSTYRFTVDTPEDQGLVSTQLTVAELPGELQSGDGSRQQYTVSNKNGIKKESELVESGDLLKVSSGDGKNIKTYYVLVKPMSLSGQLELNRPMLTANTRRSLTLSYTARQRSPDATVEIYVPPGIEVTMDNTTVNVIGRGDVKLSGLSTQSMGRTGNKYSQTKVGEVSIRKLATGAVLAFRHLDLRAANGADLVVTIGNVGFIRPGNYTFKAVYTTSRPEVLTSAGTGSETATLSVLNTIADFERTADRSLQYKETPDFYTSASFAWSPVAATALELQ